MPRQAKLYLPLDVDFFDNPRIIKAGEKATFLYLAMCCEAKRRMSDGVLTARQVAGLLIPSTAARLTTLVKCGLVMATDDGGWIILGFLDRNLSAAQVEAKREKDRFRKDSIGIPRGTTADSTRTLREVEVEVREKEEVEVKVSQREAEGEGCAHGRSSSRCVACLRSKASA